MHTQISKVIFHRNDGSAILEVKWLIHFRMTWTVSLHVCRLHGLRSRNVNMSRTTCSLSRFCQKHARAMSVRRDSSSIFLVSKMITMIKASRLEDLFAAPHGPALRRARGNIFDNGIWVGFEGNIRHAAWTSLWRFMCVYVHVHINRCLYRCIFDYIVYSYVCW